MVNSTGLNSSYGSIQRISIDSNNRMVYRVNDSTGKETGKISIAAKDVDVFEKSYKDLMISAPKIQKFSAEHSSPEDIKKRKTLSNIALAGCSIAGVAIPLFLTRGASTAKKVGATTLGLIAGVAAGFASYFSILTPPGTYKFIKATKNLSKIDVQPVQEAAILRATRM